MKRMTGIGAVFTVVLLAGCGTATDAGSAQADPSMTTAVGSASVTTVTSESPAPETSSEQPTNEQSPSEQSPSEQPPSEQTGAGGVDCAEAQGWDADTKQADFASAGAIFDVTAAAAGCFDSVTIHVKPSDAAPGYRVAYVPEVVMDGSGAPVSLAGAAKLQVVVSTPAYEDDGTAITPTLNPADRDHLVDANGLTAIRQVAFAGSFEGQTTFGIGVADALPFTVTTDRADDGGTVLTVSIAHA